MKRDFVLARAIELAERDCPLSLAEIDELIELTDGDVLLRLQPKKYAEVRYLLREARARAVSREAN